MARSSLEVGVVYKNYSCYFVAVSLEVLVSYKDGKFFEKRPYSTVNYKGQRDLDVISLCNHWGVTIEMLDQHIGDVYFKLHSPRDSSPSKKRGELAHREPWTYKPVY